MPTVEFAPALTRHVNVPCPTQQVAAGTLREALAAAMLEVLQNERLRAQLVVNASVYSDSNSWSRRKGDYLEVVDSLIARRPTMAKTERVSLSCESEVA